MATWRDFGIELPAGAAGNIKVTCPRCSSERHKSREACLSVQADAGTWLCHHCGWAGGLKQRSETQASPRRSYTRPKPDALADAKPTDELVAYFAGRGITQATIERYGITLARRFFPQRGAELDAIAFPFVRDGQLVNIKLRAIGEKVFAAAKGCEPILYGLDDIDAKELVIVEGEFDKLALAEAGIISAVSVPNGAPPPGSSNYASHFAYLDSAADVLEQVGEFVLACDADAPGRHLADELARRLGPERCRRVEWPEGIKDANEALVVLGADKLRELIAQAPPLPIRGIIDSPANLEALRVEYEHGRVRGASTGWLSLDALYTIRPGELTVITGTPNAGKSTFVDALVVNLARRDDWRVMFFSPENQPVHFHERALAEQWTLAPFFDGPRPRMLWHEVEQTIAGPIAEHFMHFLPDDVDEWTVDAILATARAMVRRRGIRGLVIDPWNEIESTRPQWMTETEFVSHTLKRIKQFARDCGVHVWLVAHPAKMYRQRDGSYPTAGLYDISGSAHFSNKADCGLVIAREGNDPNVSVLVKKIRFREVGKQGEATLRFDRATSTYRDLRDPSPASRPRPPVDELPFEDDPPPVPSNVIEVEF
jgi:twinkle protein